MGLLRSLMTFTKIVVKTQNPQLFVMIHIGTPGAVPTRLPAPRYMGLHF